MFLIVSIVIGCALLFWVQAMVYENYWHKNFKISLQFSRHQINEGDRVNLLLCVENRKWLPLPAVEINFSLSEYFVTSGSLATVQKDNQNITELFSVLMNQRVTRRLEYVCRKRGLYRIEEVAVKCGDFFHHTQFSELMECGEYLIVYPSCVRLEPFMELYQNLYGQILTRQFMQEDPFLHRGIREYQSYDAMKWIHWKATARTGDFKVHVPERTAYREVVIFLNLQCDKYFLDAQPLEEAIRLAKTFCMAFARDGVRCRVYSNGHDIETEELVTVEHVRADTSYMHAVDGRLARIKLRSYQAVVGDEEFARDNFVNCYGDLMRREARSHFLLVISNYQHSEFQQLLQELLTQGSELLWLIPVENRQDYHPEKGLTAHSRMWNLNYERRVKD